MSSLQSVVDQMRSAGIDGILPGDLIVDGRLHRFKPDGAKQRTGWYVLFEFVADDGRRLLTGSFGDWRSSDQKTTVKPSGETLSDDERDRLKKQALKKAAQK